ncbi:serum paraoxonase/arylesterase [Ramaria rubella]|nr:serum paraoxonase/arylesterase [Ramaria rubella]
MIYAKLPQSKMPPTIIRTLATLGAIVTVVFGVYYQLLLKDILTHAGYWRDFIEPLNNGHCTNVPELQACEKSVRHHASGTLYFACSTPISRTVWEPCIGRLNVSARSLTDYVATYDPSTSKTTRLKLVGFPSSQPLALHGFDIVQSDTDPSELLVYLINHRPPTGDPRQVGADSVVEVFKTKVNSDELVYVKTVRDPSVIISPNDIIGSGDGSFYFTNDARSKSGIIREVDAFLRLPGMTVGYCHINRGCKIAARGLKGANGIARNNDGLYFVTNHRFGEIFVLEKQEDGSLVLTDVVKTDMPMDNISVGEDGVLYIAGHSPTTPLLTCTTELFLAFPKILQYISETAGDPTKTSPSAVLRLSRNTGSGQFYGEKFKVEKLSFCPKIFQDNGKVVPTVTTAIWDAKQKVLYLTGITAFYVSICKVDSL